MHTPGTTLVRAGLAAGAAWLALLLATTTPATEPNPIATKQDQERADGDAKRSAELLSQAQQALADRDAERALALASQAIEADAGRPDGYRFRAAVYESLRRHREAIADLDQLLKLEPRNAGAYDRRGSEHFKLGQIEESIADFDRALEIVPEREPEHWKRGISYYYAGRYADGRKQFEGYQTFDDNDVENAVWRYLCMARQDGVEAARDALLKIKDDRRVPMMQVYALFAGQVTPEQVLEATETDSPSKATLNDRLFYAHLYLGLYYDATGDKPKAREHIRAAVEHPIGHYMWDVAHVHDELLKKDDKKDN